MFGSSRSPVKSTHFFFAGEDIPEKIDPPLEWVTEKNPYLFNAVHKVGRNPFKCSFQLLFVKWRISLLQLNEK